MLDSGPVKWPSTPNQPPPIPTAGGGSPDLRIAVFHLGEKASDDLRSQLPRPFPRRFFFRCFGPTRPDRLPYEALRERTWVMGGTFAPPPSRGQKAPRNRRAVSDAQIEPIPQGVVNDLRAREAALVEQRAAADAKLAVQEQQLASQGARLADAERIVEGVLARRRGGGGGAERHGEEV